MCFKLFFQCILVFYSYGKLLRSFVYGFVYCVGAGITILMYNSDGLDPYIFRRKMERTRPMKEEMDREVFISRPSRQFSLCR